MKDVTVIGSGLIGSAAARHLAEDGHEVRLIGAIQGNRDGVHASHYDEARITRFIGPDIVWSDLATAAISRYADIEDRSGIRFHSACGHLRCDLPIDHPDSSLASARVVQRHIENEGGERSQDEIEAMFPFLSFQPDAVFHWDPDPAGIINPRRLIDAQIELAKKSGADVVQAVCIQVERRDDVFVVRDSSGASYLSGQVLVCAGAYTNSFSLLPKALDFEIRPETVVLMEVGEELVNRLSTMPGIIWNFDHLSDVSSAYILPPVKYPDGGIYVKIGADFDKEIRIDTLGEMHTYMSSEGSVKTRELLTPVLRALVPDLADARVTSKPCLLTYTPSGYPMIDEVEKGWFVAAGGCGKSAKSSDQIGRLAANLVGAKAWDGFERSSFAAGELGSSVSGRRKSTW